MIGWRVNIYRTNGIPSKLSDMSPLDTNAPFTIPTVLPHSTFDNTYRRDSGTVPEPLIGDIQNVLGEDYFAIYGFDIFSNGNSLNNNYDLYKFLFPSFDLSIKLTYQLSLNNQDPIPFAIEFINLKKLFGYFKIGNTFYSIGYNIGNDGTLTEVLVRSSDSACPNGNPMSGNALSILCIENYTQDSDLSLNSTYHTLVNIPFGVLGSSSESYRIRYVNGIENSRTRSIINFLFDSSTKPDFTALLPDNPYGPGGDSGEGGGGGSFDNESDQISDSSLPTLSSANTGFTRIYNPTLSQVQSLAQYLWTDESVISTIWNHIKQFFENPMEAIIAFNLVPVHVPDGGTKNFALMYIDTGVQMTVAANQFVDVDCGTLEVKEYYGSALDYSPNTKISCFLPFIGTVTLNTDEVMNSTLQVKYRVDICSGSCVAKILVNGNVLYQYSGHCAIPIPLSAADFSTYVTAAISVGKLVGTALTAGAGVAATVGAEDAAQQTNQIVTTTQITNTARNPATGRQITTGTQTVVETREAPADQSSTQASFNGLSAQNIANTVGQVMSSKPHIEHSGGFSGNSGYLGIRRPFLIIERPNMCMPANFQSLNGFPSMITLELGTCKGFTRVQQVQLTGLSATNPEQAELLQLLKSGVIL